MRLLYCMAMAMTLLNASSADAASAKRSPFGTLADGRAVEAVTLTNAHGMSAKVIAYGAILQSLSVPDRDGKSEDVVLGFSEVGPYETQSPHFGGSIGRYANRIAGAKFTLDGKTYTLAKNNGPNSLHGGAAGYDKRLWTITDVQQGPTASVTLTYVSPDSEGGYPGTLNASVTYSLNEKNELAIDYRATTDKPTIVNLTHHSYFNLAGEASGKSVMGERLTIPAEAITPVDKTLIPTGELRPVAGTPFDFRAPAEIGARIRDGRDPQIVFGQGYDHNFVIARAPSSDLRLNARVEDPESGRVMEVLSTQPGVQFYSGNFLDGTLVGKSGKAYRQGDAFCLEPQLFPDTPNQPAFGSARLELGQTYENRILLRFSTTR